jgi:hypothetical protein
MGGVVVLTDRVLRMLITLLAIFLTVTAGPFLVSSVLEKVYRSTLTSELCYSVTVVTSSDLSDVTLFIPLPADGNGTSPLSDWIGTGNHSMKFPGWNVSIYGANNESYLKLWTNLLPGPDDGTESVYTYSVTAPSPPLHTRNPTRYDYTFLPRENLTPAPCGSDIQDSHPLCYRYQGLLYASYATSPGAQVQIQADLTATNRWEILQTYQNGYTDRIEAMFRGPERGWHPAEGWLVTATGDDNPFWKEQVNVPVRTNLSGGVDTSMMRWHTFTPLP